MSCPPTLPHFQHWMSRGPLQLDKCLPTTISTVTPNFVTGTPCTVFCYTNRRQSKRTQTNVTNLYIWQPPWPMGPDGLIYPTGMYPNSWEIEIVMVSDKHLPDKDHMFLAITNLHSNNWRNPKWKIYFISASCYCFEHTPICVTDSTEWLVTQDSSIINNIYMYILFKAICMILSPFTTES